MKHKLDARGVAHEFMIVGVLVIFSIVGIGYVVAGNANPGTAIAASAKPTPIPITTGEANGVMISCYIEALPTDIKHMQRLRPVAVITNEDDKSYVGIVEPQLSLFDSETYFIKEIKPNAKKRTVKKGQTIRIPLPAYRVPYAKDGGVSQGHYSFKVEGLGYCSNDAAWFNLPKNPKQKSKPKPIPTKPSMPVSTDG